MMKSTGSFFDSGDIEYLLIPCSDNCFPTQTKHFPQKVNLSRKGGKQIEWADPEPECEGTTQWFMFQNNMPNHAAAQTVHVDYMETCLSSVISAA